MSTEEQLIQQRRASERYRQTDKGKATYERRLQKIRLDPALVTENRKARSIERFWRYINKTDNCWLWTGNKTNQGYGVFSYEARLLRAHRFAYELSVGPIPKGLVIDHICHNESDCTAGDACLHRACVNPAHLRAVDSGTNIRAGKTLAAANLAKQHCPQGHPLSGENVFTQYGSRNCRTCRRERQQKMQQLARINKRSTA